MNGAKIKMRMAQAREISITPLGCHHLAESPLSRRHGAGNGARSGQDGRRPTRNRLRRQAADPPLMSVMDEGLSTLPSVVASCMPLNCTAPET